LIATPWPPVLISGKPPSRYAHPSQQAELIDLHLADT
jgi:hypothetical protein